jgi:hypothetical protein
MSNQSRVFTCRNKECPVVSLTVVVKEKVENVSYKCPHCITDLEEFAQVTAAYKFRK